MSQSTVKRQHTLHSIPRNALALLNVAKTQNNKHIVAGNSRSTTIMSSKYTIQHITHDEVRGFVKFPRRSTPTQLSRSPFSPYFTGQENLSSSLLTFPRLRGHGEGSALGDSPSSRITSVDDIRNHGHFVSQQYSPAPAYSEYATGGVSQHLPNTSHTVGSTERLLNKVYNPRTATSPTTSNSNESNHNTSKRRTRYENPRPSPKTPIPKSSVPKSPSRKRSFEYVKYNSNMSPSQTPESKILSRNRMLHSIETANSKLRGSLESANQAFSSFRQRGGSPASEDSFDCRGINYDVESQAIEKLYKVPNDMIEEHDLYDILNEEAANALQQENNLTKVLQAASYVSTINNKQRREEDHRHQALQAVNFANAFNGLQLLCSKCNRRSATDHSDYCQLCLDSAARAWTTIAMSSTSMDIPGGGDLPCEYIMSRTTSPTPPPPVAKDVGYQPRQRHQNHVEPLAIKHRQNGEYASRTVKHPDYLGRLAHPSSRKFGDGMREIKNVGARGPVRVVESDSRILEAISADVLRPWYK